jgi:hypothetical protein
MPLQLQLFQQVHQMNHHPNLPKKAMLMSSMMTINVFTFLKQCLQDFLKKCNNSDGGSDDKKKNQPSKAQLKVAENFFLYFKYWTENNTSRAVQWIKAQNLFINCLSATINCRGFGNISCGGIRESCHPVHQYACEFELPAAKSFAEPK